MKAEMLLSAKFVQCCILTVFLLIVLSVPVSAQNSSAELNNVEANKLIDLAKEKGAALSENSDGHTFFEIGENEEIEKLLKDVGLNGDDVFFNRNDSRLDQFLAGRKKIRENM